MKKRQPGGVRVSVGGGSLLRFPKHGRRNRKGMGVRAGANVWDGILRTFVGPLTTPSMLTYTHSYIKQNVDNVQKNGGGGGLWCLLCIPGAP